MKSVLYHNSFPDLWLVFLYQGMPLCTYYLLLFFCSNYSMSLSNLFSFEKILILTLPFLNPLYSFLFYVVELLATPKKNHQRNAIVDKI